MQLRPANGRRRWRSRTREPRQAEVSQRRFLFLKALIVVLFGVLVLQLARMQIVQHEDYRAQAELNRLRQALVLPARGHILDRNGEELVRNIPIFSAGVVPADVRDDQFLQVVAELSRVSGLEPQKIANDIVQARQSDDPFTPLVVKPGLDDETAFRLRERQAELPGLQVLVESVRRYPAGPLASQVMGYVGRISAEEFAALRDDRYLLNDRIGKTGVELTYESVLRGTPGYDLNEVDASGRKVRTVRSVAPRPAGNLVLAFDLDLQRRVTGYLQEAMADSGSVNASAVVMDVRTGEVLSIVSLPTYDNNVLTDPVDEAGYMALLEHPARPLVNHAIGDAFAPGSTFKIVTGSAALQEGVATPSTTITSRGSISVGSFVFNDWSALGTLDFYGGLVMSSDVYYYHLAGGYQGFVGLGVERLAAYAREYGFGAPTGIDLPGETAGLVPDPAWKEETVHEPWYIGNTYHFGIGQGYLSVTSLQLARMTAALANGGQVLVPHVVREIVDDQGNSIRRVEPEVAHELSIADHHLEVVREALRRAAAQGTATSGASGVVTIGGKTGTAEFGPRLPSGNFQTHAWYTGFAPFENPEIAVAVFLEKGRGAADAGPVVSQIFDYYFGRKLLAEGETP